MGRNVFEIVPEARRIGSGCRSALALVRQSRARRTAARQQANDESGAILVLALVFLVSISLIVTGLLTWVGTSLTATGAFANERNAEYAATDAVNLAIQNTRYTFDAGTPNPFLNNAVPEQCASYTGSGQTNPVTVYCSMVWQPYSADTRVFTYSACSYSTLPANPGPDCAASPLLQVIVAFDDYPPGVASPSPSPSGCTPILPQTPGGADNGSCGESMTQISWQWNPVVPNVQSLNPSQPGGPVIGGTTFMINGTGFTSAETVNFVEQANQLPTPGTYNPPVAGTILAPSANCSLPTCIQVTSPPVTNGTAYTVTVTTSGGTSQTTPNDSNTFVPTFTYAAVKPTVTGLVGTVSGQITGNATVTIQGTGFWNAANNTFPATVSFCPTVGGGACQPGTVVSISPPAPGSNLDTMTALTPPVSPTGSSCTNSPGSTPSCPYYVQVGVFAQTSTSTSAIFTYTVQAPLIISLSPTTAGITGSLLSIVGANFVTGSTVGFCPWVASPPQNYSTTCTQTAGTVQLPVTSTQINVFVPALPTGSYYPIVNLPSSYNTPPSQPYNQAADIFQHS